MRLSVPGRQNAGLPDRSCGHRQPERTLPGWAIPAGPHRKLIAKYSVGGAETSLGELLQAAMAERRGKKGRKNRNYGMNRRMQDFLLRTIGRYLMPLLSTGPVGPVGRWPGWEHKQEKYP